MPPRRKSARIYAFSGRFQWPKSAGRLRSKTALTPRPKSKNGVKREKRRKKTARREAQKRKEEKSREAKSVCPLEMGDICISSSPIPNRSFEFINKFQSEKSLEQERGKHTLFSRTSHCLSRFVIAAAAVRLCSCVCVCVFVSPSFLALSPSCHLSFLPKRNGN